MMQKKICFGLLGYIVVLSAIGVWFYFHQELKSLPVLEKALIEEIASSISKEDIIKYNNKEDPSFNAENTPEESSSNDYWGNYNQETTDISDTEKIVRQLENAEISTGDKMKALYILKKNLSNEEINLIVSKVKNGFTTEEKAEVKALLLKKLGSADQQELKDIVLKYL